MYKGPLADIVAQSNVYELCETFAAHALSTNQSLFPGVLSLFARFIGAIHLTCYVEAPAMRVANAGSLAVVLVVSCNNDISLVPLMYAEDNREGKRELGG